MRSSKWDHLVQGSLTWYDFVNTTTEKCKKFLDHFIIKFLLKTMFNHQPVVDFSGKII